MTSDKCHDTDVTLRQTMTMYPKHVTSDRCHETDVILTPYNQTFMTLHRQSTDVTPIKYNLTDLTVYHRTYVSSCLNRDMTLHNKT